MDPQDIYALLSHNHPQELGSIARGGSAADRGYSKGNDRENRRTVDRSRKWRGAGCGTAGGKGSGSSSLEVGVTWKGVDAE